jgi:hypothetical protein
MSDASVLVRIPGASWTLEFRPRALRTFLRHSQRLWQKRESVGQLFASDLCGDLVVVEEATRLSTVWSGRGGVKFDPRRAEAERAALFSRGFHCIGLWHTHPELAPRPSIADLELAAEHASAAQPTLTGLVFVIVGTAPWPTGLGIWVHDGTTAWATEPVLSPMSSSCTP